MGKRIENHGEQKKAHQNADGYTQRKGGFPKILCFHKNFPIPSQVKMLKVKILKQSANKKL